MAEVRESIEMGAPPERVWEKLTDLDSYPEWLTIHQGFPDGHPDQLNEGDTFKQKVTIMGMPGEINWTVTKKDEAREIAMEGKGPMGTNTRAVFMLEPNGDGTTVSYESEFGGAAIAAMAGPLEKEARKSSTESLEKLRQLVS